MGASTTSNTKTSQHKQQRTKQLTTLTVLMLTMLTVLTQLPTKSAAATLFDIKKMSSIAASPASTITIVQSNIGMSNSIPTVLQQLAESGDNGHRVRRKRLRKRHNASILLSQLAENVNDITAPLEWVNTCGGQEVTPRIARVLRVGNSKFVRKQLKDLKKSLRYENLTLSSLHKIIIDDMDAWRLHSKKYRFLPSLNRTEKINLRNWHRAMQTFVASFAELGVKQYRWDQEKRQHVSELTHELNSLLLSAKRVLCEVESAFNVTHPQAKLPKISREEMQKKLKFYTKDEKREVNRIDLKFAKHRFNKYIQNMFHALRRRYRRSKMVAKASTKSLTSSASIENSSQWATLAQTLKNSEAQPLESVSGA
ncbi:uncharacterized protein [Eurosta solidaginis]|uniref:uncharacterized protein n=1 Tax=Eurosta solidaginis TaxID=178769 RepID=UPI0035313274